MDPIQVLQFGAGVTSVEASANAPYGASLVAVVSRDGQRYFADSTDGVNWNERSPTPEMYAPPYTMAGDTRIVASALIHSSQDGGVTWTQRTRPNGFNYRLSVMDSRLMYIQIDGGGAMTSWRSDDLGATWQVGPGRNSVFSYGDPVPLGSHTVLLFGSTTKYITRSDGTAAWTTVATLANSKFTLHQLDQSSAVALSTSSGGAVGAVTTDSGATWQSVPNPGYAIDRIAKWRGGYIVWAPLAGNSPYGLLFATSLESLAAAEPIDIVGGEVGGSYGFKWSAGDNLVDSFMVMGDPPVVPPFWTQFTRARETI